MYSMSVLGVIFLTFIFENERETLSFHTPVLRVKRKFSLSRDLFPFDVMSSVS